MYLTFILYIFEFIFLNQIKILHKNNTQLDKDLIKLAELSENKPETFKMLLSTLRSM